MNSMVAYAASPSAAPSSWTHIDGQIGHSGTDGTIKFHNGSPGTAQIIADTAGYYIGS
jgi:hypothetical protein